MITPGNVLRPLSWWAGLAFFGVAALLAPARPAQGQDDPKKRADALRARDVLKLRLDSLQLEPQPRGAKSDVALDKEESELLLRLAKVRAARRRLADAREAEARKKGGTVHVHIEITASSADLKALQEVLKKLGTVLPTEGKRTIRMRGVAEDRLWKVVPGAPGARVVPAPPMKAPELPKVRFLLRGPGDGRIDALEKKLDDVLKQIEALRRELKAPRPGARALPLGVGVPGPRPAATPPSAR
jgi:hypothetical protein